MYTRDDTLKSQSCLYLVDFIRVVSKEFIIRILYGRFLLIMSEIKNNPTDEQKNLVLRIALDLAKDLIENYFYKKFQSHRSDLIKSNQISSEKEYTLSD